MSSSSAGNSLPRSLFAAGLTPEKTFFFLSFSFSPPPQSAKSRRPAPTAAVETAVMPRTRRWKRVADSRGKGDLAGGMRKRKGKEEVEREIGSMPRSFESSLSLLSLSLVSLNPPLYGPDALAVFLGDHREDRSGTNASLESAASERKEMIESKKNFDF